MTDDLLHGVARVTALVSIALVIAAVVFVVLSRHSPAPVALLFRGSESMFALTMAVMGALIVMRKPRHPIGWLFCAAGLSASLIVVGEHYAVYSYLTRDALLPGAPFAGWIQSWVGIPGYFVPLAFLLLLFPTGHLVSRRLRPVGWLVAFAGVAVSVTLPLAPGPVDVLSFVDNPFGVGGGLGRAITAAGDVSSIVLFAGVVLSAIAFIYRFVRSRGAERQQLKWLASAAAALIVVFGSIIATGNRDTQPVLISVLFLAALELIPIATAIAILRHRLFDIDRLISRTLSYAIVTAVLATTFVVVALVPTVMVGTGAKSPDWLVAVATLIVAALFRPVRRHVQDVVDHRFNRAHYDAAHTIDAFAARLRDEIDIDGLGAELQDVVSRTMQPAHVSLWLRDSEPAR